MRPLADGFTLIELMVTLAVAVILTLVSVPAIQGLLERQRLSAAVEAVQAQVVLAKSEATKRSQDVTLSVVAGPPWRSTLAYFDLVSAATVNRVVEAGSYAGITMQSPSAGSTLAFTFESVRGTVNPGQVTLASTSHQVDIRVDEVGRMTVCSPDFGRYPVCN